MTPSSASRIALHLSESRHAVAFTGAGISTESGIPDFRSPGGVWSKHRAIRFQARPNAGHIALACLEAAGRLEAVITQNVDGLHQRAGSRRVLELHGSARRCVCLGCGARHDPDAVQARLEAGEEVPLCPGCGGLLKSAAIFFGQPLPGEVLSEALALCRKCDLVLAIGSSLLVEPAASLPLEARRNGARLVILNNSSTPLDTVADIVLREPIGAALTAVTGILGLDRVSRRCP